MRMKLTEDLKKILNLGISLTGEKNYHRLLEKILAESMEITNSDAGTLYIVTSSKTEDRLKFMIMRNQTMNTYEGGQGEKINLPDVPFVEENVCAYAAIHRKVINIPDVYDSQEFDFIGPKRYDKITGYRTKSMLVIPLENHENEILGVIQLINALDEEKKVIPYDRRYEYIIYSIASQAAVTLANMNHDKDMKRLLDSMVSAFTTAIDERTPYNANHTKNVANYTKQLIDYINEQYKAGNTNIYYDDKQKEQLIMAAMLHDIGKLVTPLEIMNKSTRLEESEAIIENRFELIAAYLNIDFLEERISKEEYREKKKYLKDMKQLIREVNKAPFLEDEVMEKIEELSNYYYCKQNGEIIHYITDNEKESLLIKKGTLTSKERKIMEEHVVVTSRLLQKIHFGKEYKDVPKLASAHHEYLNGTGYPNHLTWEQIPKDAELLTVLDIYDSLISTDRPYKKPIPKERALIILEEMVKEGKLDGELVKQLKNMVQ